MTYEFILSGTRVSFRVERQAASSSVILNGAAHDFSVEELSLGRLVLRNSAGQSPARVVRERDRIWVWIDGRTYAFQVPSAESQGEAEAGQSDEIRAPMPGTLIKVMVAPGDTVEDGQVVAVVEAMKMEHQLRAPRAGTIEIVGGKTGAVVDADTVIVSLVREEKA